MPPPENPPVGGRAALASPTSLKAFSASAFSSSVPLHLRAGGMGGQGRAGEVTGGDPRTECLRTREANACPAPPLGASGNHHVSKPASLLSCTHPAASTIDQHRLTSTGSDRERPGATGWSGIDGLRPQPSRVLGRTRTKIGIQRFVGLQKGFKVRRAVDARQWQWQ